MRVLRLALVFLLVAGGAAASETSAVTQPATLLHVSINRPATDVYAYASDPRNLPQWAAGLSRSPLRQMGGDWIADSPMGTVKIRFTPRNVFGVVDHDVTLPDGVTVTNPLRIQPNGNGAEVIFTLYRRADVTEADFKEEVARVRRDLEKLKSILER
jgi:hypothetical protein